MRRFPSAFFTNKIGAPYGDLEGCISPNLSISAICVRMVPRSNGYKLYGIRCTGLSSARLISCSKPRLSGKPGILSGNTVSYLQSKSFKRDLAFGDKLDLRTTSGTVNSSTDKKPKKQRVSFCFNARRNCVRTGLANSSAIRYVY
jgi:hypothetical protein